MTDANPIDDGQSPTSSEAEQTPQEPSDEGQENPPVEVEEEVITNHPLYKTLQEENSANEREKERYKGRLNKVQEGLQEEKKKVEPKKEPTEYVTREELWESQNSKEIELYADEEYEKDVEDGIPKEKALKYSKLRFEANPDEARLNRQKDMASGSPASNRDLSDTSEITDKDRENMKKWGYSEEALKKQKQLKKDRQTA
tara:strand:- start:1142 stop:1741 length:600 start_codon:yes stop_codon:yes gene_type:complete